MSNGHKVHYSYDYWGAMPDKVSAKSFLTEVADRFTKSDKVETSTHLSKLVNMCYNDKGNIREYIMKNV